MRLENWMIKRNKIFWTNLLLLLVVIALNFWEAISPGKSYQYESIGLGIFSVWFSFYCEKKIFFLTFKQISRYFDLLIMTANFVVFLLLRKHFVATYQQSVFVGFSTLAIRIVYALVFNKEIKIKINMFED